MPEGKLYLPVFYDTLKTLDQTVEVDYYLPGCPPRPDSLLKGLMMIQDEIKHDRPFRRGTIIDSAKNSPGWALEFVASI